jgi:hypothetical protein
MSFEDWLQAERELEQTDFRSRERLDETSRLH